MHAFWNLLLIVLGILSVLAMLTGAMDGTFKAYAFLPQSILGLLILGKILAWD